MKIAANYDHALEHMIIVHELGRRWVDALRGHPTTSRIRIRHSASVVDTLAMTSTAHRMTLLVDLGHDPLESLDLLERVGRGCQEVVMIVVARSEQDHLELAARELGAIAFLREPISGT